MAYCICMCNPGDFPFLCIAFVCKTMVFMSPPRSVGFANFPKDLGTDPPYALFFSTREKKTHFCKRKEIHG